MTNIAIINFSKGPCDVEREQWATSDPGKFKMNVTPRLRYSDDSDYVGFQLDITVTCEKMEILKTGFLIGMEVDGWSKAVKSKESDILNDICQTGWLVATGIVAEQTSYDKRTNVILPRIEISNLVKEIQLCPYNHKEQQA
jgi:hypothetical protein